MFQQTCKYHRYFGECKFLIYIYRGGSRTAVTSKMATRSILDVAAALDPLIEQQEVLRVAL